MATSAIAIITTTYHGPTNYTSKGRRHAIAALAYHQRDKAALRTYRRAEAIHAQLREAGAEDWRQHAAACAQRRLD